MDSFEIGVIVVGAIVILAIFLVPKCKNKTKSKQENEAEFIRQVVSEFIEAKDGSKMQKLLLQKIESLSYILTSDFWRTIQTRAHQHYGFINFPSHLEEILEKKINEAVARELRLNPQ